MGVVSRFNVTAQSFFVWGSSWASAAPQLSLLSYNITLLPSVYTMIARAVFCGAKYTHHTFTPIIKHLITTTAKQTNKIKKIQVKSHS